MTRISAGPVPVCANKGSEAYCLRLRTTSSLGQSWVLTAALDKYGAGLPLPVPLDFARRHRGASEVFLRVYSFGTPAPPQALLHTLAFTGADSEGYSPLREAGINSGGAARIDSLANGGLTELRFVWVSGRSIVEVDVLGWRLTVREAQAIARRARPA